MQNLDKKFQELQITIDKGSSEYQRALKALDEIMSKMIKTEERKQRMLRNRLFNF